MAAQQASAGRVLRTAVKRDGLLMNIYDVDDF
jgi:hypothetical protein